MSEFTHLNGWGLDTSPFHANEVAAQKLAGVDQFADSAGRRGIRRYMPEQHRAFYAEQPFMIFGGVDASGQPWATMRTGEPGFVTSPDANTLRIHGGALPDDPLEGRWQSGAMIGGLGIQPHTRRRNRINGVVASIDGDDVTLEVSQSFGNCAKYIQGRKPTFIERGASFVPVPQEVAATLSDADRALIARADTLFIASANTSDEAGLSRGVDVSHRGGVPGFVRVDDVATLTMPDFAGNKFFNTIGNLLHDPRAGLLFVDFDKGDLLYLAVRAEIVWQGGELASFEGAERLMRFHLQEVRRSKGVLPFRWSEVEYAPQFAEAMRKAASPWRKLKVAAVVEETPSIRSFWFEAVDGAALPAYQPGQYLPIRVPVTAGEVPLTRTYTLSDAHDPRHYRISVKREGVASRWLHEHLAAGVEIEAMAPRGAFVFDASSPRPAVFISAGIGMTPMIAMLHHVLADDKPDATDAKPVFFFHGARSDHERPFSAHLKELAARHPSLSMHLYDSAASTSETVEGVQQGRVDIAALKRALPFDDYDFYLCGPESFMRDLYEGLRALNVADERIRFEAFGPASVKRTPSVVEPVAEPEAGGAQVTFARSERTIQWLPKHGSLLEFAEKNGIDAKSSCRSGMCGTCSTRLLSGSVAYDGDVDAEIEPGHALICMAHPVVEGGNASVTLDL
jgi:uncharacterized protein